MRKSSGRNVLSRRGLIKILVVLIIALGCYFIFVYKPSSKEFLELQRQEKILSLPKPWRRDTSDFGCQWVFFEQENQCAREISLVYKNTNLKPDIEQSLLWHGWTPHHDTAINLNSRDFDKTQPVHFDSWDLYLKRASTGELCAVVKSEYNVNYQKKGPWAVNITLFDKTEGCNDHAK